MRVTWKRFLQQLGIRQKAPQSGVFVSVNVSKNARSLAHFTSSGLSRQSTRVIVQISLWTCIVLVFLFLVIYTIILAYVDKKFRPVSLHDPYSVTRKVKISGRPVTLPEHGTSSRGKEAWNSSALYLYNSQVMLPHCKWQALLSILVTSAPDHLERRQRIRATWCHAKLWDCVFLIGTPSDPQVESALFKEQTEHQDILLGGYVDSYRNLTLKVLHGFHWSAHWCPSSYVLKTDDDCFVNAGLLHSFLQEDNQLKHGLYAGKVVQDMERLAVVRDTSRKWAVSKESYSLSHYPPYPSGMGYILSFDVVLKLVNHSSQLVPFANEDAFVGVVLSQVDITPTSSSRFVLSYIGLRLCNYMYVFLVHDVMPENQSDLWEMSKEAEIKCQGYEKVVGWS